MISFALCATLVAAVGAASTSHNVHLEPSRRLPGFVTDPKFTGIARRVRGNCFYVVQDGHLACLDQDDLDVTWKSLLPFDEGSPQQYVAVYGKHVYAGSLSLGTVVQFDAETGTPIGSYNLGGRINGVTEHDGSTIICQQRSATRFNTTDQSVIQVYDRMSTFCDGVRAVGDVMYYTTYAYGPPSIEGRSVSTGESVVKAHFSRYAGVMDIAVDDTNVCMLSSDGRTRDVSESCWNKSTGESVSQTDAGFGDFKYFKDYADDAHVYRSASATPNVFVSFKKDKYDERNPVVHRVFVSGRRFTDGSRPEYAVGRKYILSSELNAWKIDGKLNPGTWGGVVGSVKDLSISYGDNGVSVLADGWTPEIKVLDYGRSHLKYSQFFYGPEGRVRLGHDGQRALALNYNGPAFLNFDTGSGYGLQMKGDVSAAAAEKDVVYGVTYNQILRWKAGSEEPEAFDYSSQSSAQRIYPSKRSDVVYFATRSEVFQFDVATETVAKVFEWDGTLTNDEKSIRIGLDEDKLVVSYIVKDNAVSKVRVVVYNLKDQKVVSDFVVGENVVAMDIAEGAPLFVLYATSDSELFFASMDGTVSPRGTYRKPLITALAFRGTRAFIGYEDGVIDVSRII